VMLRRGFVTREKGKSVVLSGIEERKAPTQGSGIPHSTDGRLAS
jgi:hypothetical protein